MMKPYVQRRIMAIICMVPIYSVSSWLSLVMGANAQLVFDSLRDCYEAYVVYTFLYLLITILEDGKGHEYLINRIKNNVEEEQREAEQALLNNIKPNPLHITPPLSSILCCCFCCDTFSIDYSTSSKIALSWLEQCKLLAMQFVISKIVLTILPFFIVLMGVDYYNISIISETTATKTNIFQRINPLCPRLYIIVLENISVISKDMLEKYSM